MATLSFRLPDLHEGCRVGSQDRCHNLPLFLLPRSHRAPEPLIPVAATVMSTQEGMKEMGRELSWEDTGSVLLRSRWGSTRVPPTQGQDTSALLPPKLPTLSTKGEEMGLTSSGHTDRAYTGALDGSQDKAGDLWS